MYGIEITAVPIYGMIKILYYCDIPILVKYLAYCQCRDFPQSYVKIPFAIATSNLFHNFLSLDPHFFIFNILVCLAFHYSIHSPI